MPKAVLTEKYVFSADHIFYPELATYAVTQIALSTAYTCAKGESFPRLIMNKGVVTHSVLLNPQILVAMMDPGVRSSGLPIEYSAASFDREPGNAQGPAYFVPPEIWNTVAQVCLGSAYERISGRVKDRYRADPWSWPPELQYFRHIRNGCFHNNRFNLRPTYKHKTAIDSANPPRWRTSVLTDDESVAGKRVLGSYLYSGDVPILLADMAQVFKSSPP